MWQQPPSNRQYNPPRPPGPPPGGIPGGPPGGMPGSGPFGVPPGAPNKPNSSSGAPTSPPPNFIPNQAQATSVKGTQNVSKSQGPIVKAVDPGAIFPCIYKYVYIWPNYGPSYWMYVTFVGRYSVAGWRYYRRRWVYFSTDLRRIQSFYCY